MVITNTGYYNHKMVKPSFVVEQVKRIETTVIPTRQRKHNRLRYRKVCLVDKSRKRLNRKLKNMKFFVTRHYISYV